VARPEPFRNLLDKAMQAEVPVKRAGSAPRVAPAPQASPAPVLDDEHKPTLEQRLDAAILAAGATPPHGLRPPKAIKELVPLRIAPPQNASTPPTNASTPPTSTRDAAPVDGERAPTPRMLQFLLEERTTPGGLDESVSAIPRLEPVLDSGKLEVSVGVATNVYRLSRLFDDDTPSRPLPIIAFSEADEVFDTEVSRQRRRDKVVTRSTLDGFGIQLRTFSLKDPRSSDFEIEVGFDDSRPHAAAALALPALSEEGLPEDDVGVINDGGLDELARQLGLEGLVPRTSPPERADDSLDGGALEEISPDDVELVAVATPTNPMRAMVMSRPVVPADAVDALEGDDEDTVAQVAVESFAAVTPPSGTRKLPPSLLEGTPLHGAAKAKAAFDENEVTPALAPPARLSLEAPSAVRFVVAEAPARPRHEALSPKELARARARAHDLYLIALDDLACKDVASAIVHLELALAYDDKQPLYHDLLAQLQRQVARHLPDVEH